MKKQQFSLGVTAYMLLAACAFAVILVILNSANNGIYKQLHLYDAFNAKSQINNQNAGEINNEDALQLNRLNNGTNQFMINEFKNTYRVKA